MRTTTPLRPASLALALACATAAPLALVGCGNDTRLNPGGDYDGGTSGFDFHFGGDDDGGGSKPDMAEDLPDGFLPHDPEGPDITVLVPDEKDAKSLQPLGISLRTWGTRYGRQRSAVGHRIAATGQGATEPLLDVGLHWDLAGKRGRRGGTTSAS